MKNLMKWASSREHRFPKTLFTLSWCRIAEDDGSRDLLSQSRMHIDKQDEVALAMQQQRRQKTRCIGDSWLFIATSSVAATHIYREDPPRVRASHNWLGLSLSKRIRHGLVTKINGKRRSRICEALGRIPVDYSHVHHAPVLIATSHHATPDPVRRGERPHVCVSPFLLSSTHLQVHREQPTL
jgi:hypothetical protein